MVELYALFLGRIAEGDALNGQLTNELINKYEELSLVFTLGDALNVSKKQDEALEIIFGAIRGALNADLTLLWFPGLDFERASTPDCDEWRDLNHALLARLRSTRDSFAMNDLSGDPKLAAYGDRLRNIAATLVEVDGDQGVLAISRDDEHAPMRMNDLRILEAIARETSIFLANKKLQDARTQLFDLTIFAMARLSESRDDDTGAHLHRVSSYCVLLTKVLFSRKKYCVEDPEAFIENIARSSILHDIGKVGIPDAILLKPGKLTDEEFEVMKTHAMIGGDTIRDIEEQLNWGENNFLTLGRQIAYSHHEKWNGTGYPNGLEGTTIPLAARIMAVADVYDALTTKRCYKEAFSHGKAVEILTADSGSHFDPATIEAFLACEAEFDAVRRSHQGLDIEEPLSIPSLSQLGTEWLSKA